MVMATTTTTTTSSDRISSSSISINTAVASHDTSRHDRCDCCHEHSSSSSSKNAAAAAAAHSGGGDESTSGRRLLQEQAKERERQGHRGRQGQHHRHQQQQQRQTQTQKIERRKTNHVKFKFRVTIPCLFWFVNALILTWFGFILSKHPLWNLNTNNNNNDKNNNNDILLSSSSSVSMTKQGPVRSLSSSSDNNKKNTAAATTTTNRIRKQETGTQNLRKATKTQKTKTKKIPIFYNLFIKNRRDVKRVQHLVNEQFSLLNRTIHGPVYIISIGYNPITATPLRNNDNSTSTSNQNSNKNQSWKDFLFGRRNDDVTTTKADQDDVDVDVDDVDADADVDVDVIHLAHYDEGMERLTLQSIWDYCQEQEEERERSFKNVTMITDLISTDVENTAAADDAVIYLHSKGSYTPSPENDLLRRFLTKGALSPDCANAVMTSSSSTSSSSASSSSPATATATAKCNTCSSRFSPLPHSHTSGNMWSASCSYIRQLIPPNKFRKRMGRLSLYRHGDDREKAQPCKGTGRYAFEHWIHSHPTNRPCDLYTSSNFTWNYGGLPIELNDEDFRLKEAPRFPSLKTYDDPTVCPIPPLDHRLQEFRELYDGQIPSQDTWWGYRMYNDLRRK